MRFFLTRDFGIFRIIWWFSIQNVQGPTHRDTETLDMLIIWSSETSLTALDIRPGLCPSARHFIILAASVDRDVNGGPVGRN